MDITLHYQEAGAGEPLILLHGNGENGEYFRHQIVYFSQKYRVIAVDTRGHGQSPRGTAPFTIQQFAGDLKDFMDQLEISRAVLLGFSDGANIAMKFALSYPERVKALILNGGNLNAAGVKRLVQLPIEIGYWMAKRFAEKSADAKASMELLGLMVNEPNIPAVRLREIHAPVLVIAGTRDMIKKSHTEELAQSFPNARLAFVKGNHFIAAKNPQAFNQTVESFLENLG
ncbi:MAG: alpha/beta hydrolase [Oscillospiraceae bacterium]|jgi:pimeloyl-ACP methyl ester carboxylesterase|nr:alpha/beta hydrolase [Oscillospiraceae bacterium]